MTDTLPEFTDDDLDVLQDALEAWEAKDQAGEIMGSLVDSMFTQRAGPMPPEIAAKREQEHREKSAEKRLRKERSVLLRAKLIQIRDRRRAESMTREALRP